MSANRSIILIGFMASGKTHIGQILAQRLGLELVDLDQVIERRFGQKITEIFAHKGEAYFREIEFQTLKELQGFKPRVIVCGGGTPLFFASAQELRRLGDIFYLDASFELIVQRLSRSTKRPLGLVHTAAEVGHLRDLYNFRRPIYLSLGIRLDVSHEDQNRTVLEIIERFSAACSLAKLERLRVVDACFPYEIFLGTNNIEQLSYLLSHLGLKNHRPVIITSLSLSHVLKAELARLCPDALIIAIKDGEQHKNWPSIEYIHERLFELGCTRQTVILAVGGGVVGDVAGFAASTYMRGLPLIQVPTTLLSMVDSSVGGKTGIDTAQGKNLVGSFSMPRAVLIDLNFLSTLPPKEYACGMAEIIKHALIADAELFSALSKGPLDELFMIKMALAVKIRLVVSDPYEANVRAYLNFGHTFAHAIEKVSCYGIRHGQAVAMGMVLATKLAKKLGVLEQDFLPELLRLLEKFKLPTHMPALDPQALLAAMKHDKKRGTKDLRFILPKKIGNMLIQAVSDEDVFG